MKIFVTTLILFVGCFINITSQAQTKVLKVAILPPVARTTNVTDMQIGIIRAELSKAISSDNGYEAFSRSDIDAIINEQKFQQSGMVSDEQRARLGKVSGANIICIATLTADADNFYVEASFLDVETGRVLKYADQLMPFKPNSEIKKGCALLTQQLLGYSTDVSSTPTVKKYNLKNIDMITIEGGSFMMGCTREQGNCDDNEIPAHKVTVKSFKISKTEITVAQFAKFVESAGYTMTNNDWKKWCDGDISKCNLPATSITWNDAVAFCNWVGGRLPTEAEWEYAARGGNKSENYKYSGSNNIFDIAWFEDNSAEPPQPVATKKPNELGLYDMSGNAQEWCSDWYDKDYYSKRAGNNPTGASAGTFRINRGGSWTGNAEFSRSAYRSANLPTDNYSFLGFRLVIGE